MKNSSRLIPDPERKPTVFPWEKILHFVKTYGYVLVSLIGWFVYLPISIVLLIMISALSRFMYENSEGIDQRALLRKGFFHDLATNGAIQVRFVIWMLITSPFWLTNFIFFPIFVAWYGLFIFMRYFLMQLWSFTGVPPQTPLWRIHSVYTVSLIQALRPNLKTFLCGLVVLPFLILWTFKPLTSPPGPTPAMQYPYPAETVLPVLPRDPATDCDVVDCD